MQNTSGDPANNGPDWIEGKDRRLEVLSEAPLVLATPIGLLAGKRITDKHSLFIRNIQDLAEGHTLEPRSIEGWEIELTGLLNPSRVVINAVWRAWTASSSL